MSGFLVGCAWREGEEREVEGDILGMGSLSAIAVGIAEVAAGPEETRDSRVQSARRGAW
jgi:hypothetical protein